MRQLGWCSSSSPLQHMVAWSPPYQQGSKLPTRCRSTATPSQAQPKRPRSLSSTDSQRPLARSLIAVTTSNVWSKTKLMLKSLSASHDSHELLVIDESSTDKTPERLAEHNVNMMQVPKVSAQYNVLTPCMQRPWVPSCPCIMPTHAYMHTWSPLMISIDT